MRSRTCWLWMALLCLPGIAYADLQAYLQKPEPVYNWTEAAREETPQGTIIRLEVTSQTWQDIVWKHRVNVVVPKTLASPDTALLFITGGGSGEEETQLGLLLANQIGAVMAVLHDIPNQPLFGGKTEDELIAYSFVEYLRTKDENWPLLFPMTKGAVKAMDALQEWSRQSLETPIEHFVVTGGSKQGWTTWLTGAADPRVKTIAPIVYDNLNLNAQMRHQIESWGRYSEEIADYTVRGLQEILASSEGQPLAEMVDPYTYRDRLTMPKLLLMGTNDSYWVIDAVNLYYPDLKGDTWICYVPNAGHGLENGRMRAVGTLAAFFLYSVGKLEFPHLQWEFRVEGDEMVLEMEADREPRQMNVWMARSDDRDFRPDKWEAQPMALQDGSYVARLPLPETGYLALYGEFAGADKPYQLCTPAKVFARD